jgi:tetratricopeptide (TPR) repeat protein
MLDAEECLHLALHASSVGNHHACMTYLKQGLQQQPGNARAIYLLAAQHAELGLLERAIGGMKAAIAIEPGLEIARLQLGLLLLDRNRGNEAREHFSALAKASDHTLRLCSEAMMAVADNDSAVAGQKLSLAISQSSNRALSVLMQRLLEILSNAAAVDTDRPDGQENQVNLGAYRQLPPS